MALSVNKNIARGLNTMGYWVSTLFQATLDNSYATGGYAFTAALVKLGLIEYMAPILCLKSDLTSAVIAVFYNATPSNPATGKLVCYWGGGTLGSGGTLTLIGGQAAGVAVQVTPDSALGVLGKTTAGNIAIPFALTASGAGGVLAEVANGTDLSAYSGVGLVVGKG